MSIGLIGLAACGGAAPAQEPKAAAPSPSDDEPHSVREAEEQIADAKAELEGTPRDTYATQAPKAETKADGAPDPCQTPCHAYASMKRAVEALCRMAGNNDYRCADARRTLAEARTKVAAQCACATP